MNTFYTITILTKTFDENPESQVICTLVDVFKVVTSFDDSAFVIAFTVACNGKMLTHKDLRFGSFGKWVLNFTSEHYERCSMVRIC